jgi:UDP-N-acetylmuramoyl-tripeptide--D-alanyl-D-alanine ligase
VAIDAVSNDTRSLPGQPVCGAAASVSTAMTCRRRAGARCQRAAGRRLLPIEPPQVLVADSELALAKIATGMQRDRGTEVIAITGSNGKTTVKSCCCRSCAGPARRTWSRQPGQPNNDRPAADAARCAGRHRLRRLEMGAGKPGDIAYLPTSPARVALVNNIAPAHLERMGSLLGVAARARSTPRCRRRRGGDQRRRCLGRWFERFVGAPPRCRVLRYGLEQPRGDRARHPRRRAGQRSPWSHRAAKPAWCSACPVATTSQCAGRRQPGAGRRCRWR